MHNETCQVDAAHCRPTAALCRSTYIVCFSVQLVCTTSVTSTAFCCPQRLVPLKRGLYEDYVANFWCSTHFVVNWKRLFDQAAMLRLCLGEIWSEFWLRRLLPALAVT